MGNEAAHGVDLEVDRADAEDTIAFTEAIVDYVFVYRQRFHEFADRRRNRSEGDDEVLKLVQLRIRLYTPCVRELSVTSDSWFDELCR